MAGAAAVERQVWEALAAIPDPEIPPLSIVDLGVVDGVEVEEAEGGARVRVRLLPTFTGCPALELMRRAVRERVGALPGVGQVEVEVRLAPAWTTDRISERGREALLRFGLTPPRRSGEPGGPVTCPYCGSANTVLENRFGPTPCRAIHYCRDCRQPFERFKELA